MEKIYWGNAGGAWVWEHVQAGLPALWAACFAVSQVLPLLAMVSSANPSIPVGESRYHADLTMCSSETLMCDDTAIRLPGSYEQRVLPGQSLGSCQCSDCRRRARPWARWPSRSLSSSVTTYSRLSVGVVHLYNLVIYTRNALMTRYEATQGQGAKTSCPARPFRDRPTGSPYPFRLGCI